MASITKDGRGNRAIQFVAHDRRRRTVRLGKSPLRDVELVRTRIELLNAAQISGQAIDADTAGWLTRIGDKLHAKLCAVGLVQPRRSGTLGPFLEAYIASRVGKKPRTIINLKTAARRIREHFGELRAMRDITSIDADAFCAALHAQGYAEATAARTITRAKEFFRSAVRGKVIADNPFADVKVGSMANPVRNVSVSRETIAKVLDACPDAEWRLIVALCRYGGLRCPSEVHVLEWADVLWDRDRFVVNSPKTGVRIVPIFTELRPYLDECFQNAPPGAVHVIAKHRGDNLRTQFVRIVKRAGLVPWTRPLQNLRATRENELCEEYPEHVACAWIGNSKATARKHYLQPDDLHYDRAAGVERAAQTGACALHKPVQSTVVPCRASSSLSPEGGFRDDVTRSGTIRHDEEKTSGYPRQGSNNPSDPKEIIATRGSALHEPVQLPTCAHCGDVIGHNHKPPGGWELEDGSVICNACCVLTVRAFEDVAKGIRAVNEEFPCS